MNSWKFEYLVTTHKQQHAGARWKAFRGFWNKKGFWPWHVSKNKCLGWANNLMFFIELGWVWTMEGESVNH